ncbi:cellulose biosynthesis protein BcsN [Pannonibacter carbonis]|uniref:cellulose biosynthesis protein BcsN n=1 Tax=Pannonibacter carbonis TaxID=2067569 RepID=UPI000D0EFC06|nr:cellulose biosynthesis protein BcsN [Pannonibacter carbonis]
MMTKAGNALRFALSLAVLGSAGCAQVPSTVTAYHDAALSALTDTAPRDVGTAMALARLPEAAGQVIAVTQSRSGGIERQRITLAGDTGSRGENAIEIRLVPGKSQPAPSAATLQAEMAAAFPGRTLRLSTRLPVNAYGPFGIASDNSGCNYLWQDVQRSSDEASFFQPSKTGLAEIRVRLCRSGLTETVAVDLMQRLQLAVPGISSANLLSSLQSPGMGLSPALASVDTLLAAPNQPDTGKTPARRTRPAPTTPTAQGNLSPVLSPVSVQVPALAPVVATVSPAPVTVPLPAKVTPETLPKTVVQPVVATVPLPGPTVAAQASTRSFVRPIPLP